MYQRWNRNKTISTREISVLSYFLLSVKYITSISNIHSNVSLKTIKINLDKTQAKKIHRWQGSSVWGWEFKLLYKVKARKCYLLMTHFSPTTPHPRLVIRWVKPIVKVKMWQEDKKWDWQGAVVMGFVFNGPWIISTPIQGDWEPDL